MILEEKITTDTPKEIADVITKLKNTFKKLNLKNIDCWVAGGYFRSVFNDEAVQDIDIFFKDEESLNRVKSSELFTVTFDTKHAYKTAYSGSPENEKELLKSTIKVDLIKRYYSDPIACITDFDFSICKFAYSFKTDSLYYDNKAFVHLKAKRLVITDENFGNPIGSLRRFKKYFEYGYTISAESINKIATRIIELGTSCIPELSVEVYENIDLNDQVKINAFDLNIPNSNWKAFLEMNANSILHKSFPDNFTADVNEKTQEALVEMAKAKTIEWDKIKSFVAEDLWHGTRGNRAMSNIKKEF